MWYFYLQLTIIILRSHSTLFLTLIHEMHVKNSDFMPLFSNCFMSFDMLRESHALIVGSNPALGTIFENLFWSFLTIFVAIIVISLIIMWPNTNIVEKNDDKMKCNNFTSSPSFTAKIIILVASNPNISPKIAVCFKLDQNEAVWITKKISSPLP